MHNLEGKQSVTLDTFGGLVTLANPHDLPEGASPQNNDVDYIMGSVSTRPPLQNVFTVQSFSVGPNAGGAASSATWSNPLNVLSNSGNYASFTPVSSANSLTVSSFAFNLPSQNSISGVQVLVKSYGNAQFNLTAQLMYNGQPIGNTKTQQVGTSPGTVPFGSTGDNWGANLTPAIINNPTFSVQFSASPNSGFNNATAFLGYVTLSAGYVGGTANVNYVKTFEASDGTIKTLVLDASGTLWIEDTTNNLGTLTELLGGITPNSYSRSLTLYDREYLCFSDLTKGSDVPRQYTPQGWIDRITQIGPGAAPSFTPLQASNTQYPIINITQPASHSQGFSYFLQSSGPGSNTPGNVITFYYLDSTVAPGPDQDLVSAFNSGFPVYVYASFTGTPQPFGPQVVRVTSVGLGQPPGQPRSFYYFTFQVPTIAYTYYQGSGHGSYTANYQRTLATMTTSQPIPGVTVGSQITVAGNSVAAWNAQWTVSETPNSSDMIITGSQISGGVATFNYQVVNNTPPPQSGQLVTITNTLNANGQLNISQWPIASVSGGTTGTFTVSGYNANLTAGFETENGLAVTAGTVFDFDPGAALVGTSTNPIYGTGTGGNVVFNASGLFIDPGTYQGTVFFITRNGAVTAPAPPVVFTVPNNTTQIQASNIPIGPPNVIARGIALTEAGQNGVPGANFYTIPAPVDFYVNNVKYTATSFYVQDNTSTSATLFFINSVLLAATAIDVQGNNLFNEIELGDPAWNVSYAGRIFYGLCRGKIQNFNNLSFDGGYLPSVSNSILPLGWSVDPNFTPSAVNLLNSPIFGNSLYIKNSTGSTQSAIGLLTQSAYQDAYKVAIVQPNTIYSVRVTCRCPSGATSGAFVVDFTDSTSIGYGTTYGSFSVNLSAMTTNMQTFTGTLLTSAFPQTVPKGLLLRAYLSNAPNGGDVEIDRIEIYPTLDPVDQAKVFGSYVNNPEGFDGVTGILGLDQQNTQPVNGAAVMYDLLYFLKENSMYSTQDSPNDEPSNWTVHEVSNRVGAIGPNSWDYGEEWLVTACRNGVFVFNGGQPMKINQEIYQIWEAINWAAGNTIWVRNDIVNRKLYVGVPLPTPNPWIPNPRTPNANPTQPNVILMCSYLGLDSVTGLAESPQVHTTMFGTLNATDMRRKWTIWQIPSPFADFVKRNENNAPLLLGNGVSSLRVYQFGTSQSGVDVDLGAIPSLYTTYGFVNSAKVKEAPLLGMHRKRFNYMQALIEGQTYSGNPLTVTMLANTLNADAQHSYQVPGGLLLTSPEQEEIERPLNVAGQRIFAQFAVNQPVGGQPNTGQAGWFSLSRLIMVGAADSWAPIRGR